MITHNSDTAELPRVRTTVGVPVGRPRYPALTSEERAEVRLQLQRGVFLASFYEVGSVRDISSDRDRVHLVTIRNERLLDRFDAIFARRSR